MAVDSVRVSKLRNFIVLMFALLVVNACQAEHSPPPAAEPAPAPATRTSGATVGDTAVKRSIAREVHVTLRAKLAGEVAAKITEIAEGQGGFIVSSEVNSLEPGTVGAELTLRVPAEKLEVVLSQLRSLGQVRKELRKGEDVTSEVVDTEARLVARRALEKRLLELLTSARSIEDMLKVEAELSRVRLEIEQLAGQARTLSQRTEFALLHVSIESPEIARAAVESFGARLKQAFRSALGTSEAVVLGLIEFLGVIVPLALILALVFFPVRVLRRRARQRRAALLAKQAPL